MQSTNDEIAILLYSLMHAGMTSSVPEPKLLAMLGTLSSHEMVSRLYVLFRPHAMQSTIDETAIRLYSLMHAEMISSVLEPLTACCAGETSFRADT